MTFYVLMEAPVVCVICMICFQCIKLSHYGENKCVRPWVVNSVVCHLQSFI